MIKKIKAYIKNKPKDLDMEYTLSFIVLGWALGIVTMIAFFKIYFKI
jgi:hypothetical protein